MVVFFATGAGFASWAARTPAVQDKLDISAGGLAVAILGIEGGAVIGLPVGGALATRIGSCWTLRIGFLLYPAGMVLAGTAGDLGVLTAALALMAAATSLNDVAMNVQGVELERRAERPVLSGLHAGHSVGVLAGALIGTAAAAAGVGVAVHFTAVAVIALIAGLVSIVWLVDEPRQVGARMLARPSGPLVGLAAVAFCCFLIEGAATQWSAVHLRTEGAGDGLAAAGFATFALAIAAGRFAGDRVLNRFGRARTVRISGLVTAAGFGLAIFAPGPVVALAAWGATGGGVALIAPAVLGAAPLVGDMRPPVAIAAVTTVGYLGSFTGPPAIGVLSELTGLSAALVVALAACAVIVLLAPASLREA
jgi:predicted MFS family arabinose efflux permease